MDEKDLKSLMDQAAAPVNEQKRRETLAVAVQAFEQGPDVEHEEKDFQGNEDDSRPTDNVTKLRRRFTMSTATSRPWYTGFAAAAGLLLAVNLVFFQPGLMQPNQSSLPDLTQTQSTLTKPTGAQSEEAIRRLTFIDDQATAPAAANPVSAKDDIGNAAAVTADMRNEIRRAPALEIAEMTAGSRSFAAKRNVAQDSMIMPAPETAFREDFLEYDDNPVHRVIDNAISTFSIDVDTASYSVVRRMLNRGTLPPTDAVRVEEMVNYFDYQYPLAESRQQPFTPTVTVLDSPWKPGNKLVHIGIRGYNVSAAEVPRSNLVFLLDVSGSMNSPDKLPLVKQSLAMLLTQLRADDTVAIAVYAGAAGTILPPTPAAEKQTIMDAMGRLSAGGSTAGGAGIKLAYQLAKSAFIEDGVNRVILATDGDFNIGITNNSELTDFVERQRASGVYLSVLGFGEGNYQDARMQSLAQNGNGVAAYIDSIGEAQKVLVEEATSTLFTIAKDVKVQVEFNPATVAEYRLIGYETRSLNREDFRNDAVDAGDIGAGHTVTAIYEITPTGSASALVAPNRYGQRPASADEANHTEYGYLKLRYKQPDADESQLIQTPILMSGTVSRLQQQEAQFAVAVAGFGQLLRNSPYTGNWQLEDALNLALANRGEDRYGYRAELTQLVRAAMAADAMR